MKQFQIGAILKHTVGGVPPQVIYIYGLLDESDGIIRYVGRTHVPLARLRTHISENQSDSRCQWIRRLKEDGRLPQMQILAKTKTRANAVKLEREFIRQIHTDAVCRNN